MNIKNAGRVFPETRRTPPPSPEPRT